MSDTFTVDIFENVWTDISQGNTEGFFTNRSDTVILYRQSETAPPPTESDGHRLNPAADAVNFVLTAPERIYARSISGDTKVIVTP